MVINTEKVHRIIDGTHRYSAKISGTYCRYHRHPKLPLLVHATTAIGTCHHYYWYLPVATITICALLHLHYGFMASCCHFWCMSPHRNWYTSSPLPPSLVHPAPVIPFAAIGESCPRYTRRRHWYILPPLQSSPPLVHSADVIPVAAIGASCHRYNRHRHWYIL